MKRVLVKDRIAAEVKARIARGVYPAGDTMPTERDLAREFPTSRTTVSKALSSLSDAGLIEQAPGRGTRVLPVSERNPVGAVGIISADGVPRKPEPARILEGMQQTLLRRNQHFDLMLHCDPPESVAPEMLLERFAGALFIEGLGFERLLPELEKRRFPCVVANLEKELEATCTWVDHRKTTRTAVRVLAALGHRRIAFLTRPLHFFFYAKALAGYREALESAGIPFDESLVITSGPADAVSAYVRMREYLSERPAPTGIVAARDYLANGACQALVERGLEIGRDVSVIGFDDVSWPQEDPFLTTFAEPSFELGAVAADMLIERLISGWRPMERREIDAPLILRRSAGP